MLMTQQIAIIFRGDTVAHLQSTVNNLLAQISSWFDANFLSLNVLNPAFAGGGGGVKRPHFFRRVTTPVWRGAAAPNFG